MFSHNEWRTHRKNAMLGGTAFADISKILQCPHHQSFIFDYVSHSASLSSPQFRIPVWPANASNYSRPFDHTP